MSLRAFWDAPADFRGGDTFEVWRGDGACPGTGVSLLASGVTDLFYRDDTSAAAGQYAYKIRHRRGFGASAFSACASAREIGYALDFPNPTGTTDSSATVPNSRASGLSGFAAFSVSLYARINALPADSSGPFLIRKADDWWIIFDQTHGPFFSPPTHTVIKAHVRNASLSDALITYDPYPSPAYAANTWYPIVLTYDGANIKLYVGGALVGSAAQTGLMNDDLTGASTDPILYMGSGSGAGNFWRGNKYTIVSPVVYDRALSAIEVTAHASGLYLPFSSSRAWWPLTENAGTVAHDATGSHHADLIGSADWTTGLPLQ